MICKGMGNLHLLVNHIGVLRVSHLRLLVVLTILVTTQSISNVVRL